MFFPYHFLGGMKEFSVSINIQKGWKDYQGVVHNIYHGENIETDHHVV